MSWKANVGQVAYQPGSLEAAYTGTQIDGDTVTQFVRLVGLKRGETTTLLSATGPMTAEDAPPPYTLAGWSGDGRYLLAGHEERVRDAAGAVSAGSFVWDSVDVGAAPFKVRRIPLPAESGEDRGPLSGFLPSPSGKLFAIRWYLPSTDTVSASQVAFLYDPAHNTLRRVSLPTSTFSLEWLDDTHLGLKVLGKATIMSVSHDIVTGQEPPAPRVLAPPVPAPRAYPDLRFSLHTGAFTASDPGGKSHAGGRAVWLSIAGKKPSLAAVCLGVTLDTDDPRPVLAPNESSALWLEHGDLFLAKFAIDNASVRERYDAGEPLSCDEEREIAESNVKQIGLGLMQYVQDYDEKYPPAENFKGGVMPYIKNDAVFSVGSVPFSYAAPADLSLAAMDSPADTVLGTLTLPCATVTLYADGHVKSLPPPAAPTTP